MTRSALYLAFPLLSMAAVPRVARKGGVAERVVFGLALYEFLQFFIGTVLGLSHHLTTRSYTVATLGAAFALLVQAWRNGVRPDFTPLLRWVRTRRGAAALLLTALLALVLALELVFDGLYGTRHVDGLWYHIPRVIFWLQQGSFDAWATPSWPQLGLPIGADVVLGQKILLGKGWAGIGYVSAMLTLGAIACVYLVALELGLSRWHALMSALLFGTFPALGLRIWSANSDITAAFPLLAGFVALHRMRQPEHGLAVFIVLNGMALACKQTVVFQALLLGAIALWHCREKLAQVRSRTLPALALVLAAALMVASFFPVYRTFSDWQGGDGGRDHKVASVAEFEHAVAMSAAHWLLEPLGYLTPVPALERPVKEIARETYNAAGAHFQELPDKWKPWPAQDIGRSGLAALLFLPILLYGFPARLRLLAGLFLLLGFVPLSGILHSQPYFARYTIVLLAGYALIWGGNGFFLHGRRRSFLIGIVALNLCALLAVVSLRYYVDLTRRSRPGGAFHYLSEADRGSIAATLKGRPLQVITNESLDALLLGQRIDYPLSYILCPPDGDWGSELRKAAGTSNCIVIVHGGRDPITVGPADWHRPGSHSCGQVWLHTLEAALQQAGWRLYRRDHLVDQWRMP